MKAMYIDAPGQVSIKDVEMPVRKEGEVLLKILYGGICGSDLGSYRGTFAYFDYPRIPGHEFSAEVIEAATHFILRCLFFKLFTCFASSFLESVNLFISALSSIIFFSF